VLPFEEHRVRAVSTDVTTGSTTSHRLGLGFRVSGTGRPSAVLVARSHFVLGPWLAPHLVVFGRRTDAFDKSTTPSSHALASTFRERLELVASDLTKSQTTRSTEDGLPWGFLALRRFRKQAATNTGIASSGCAAPSGFRSLLTPYSARIPSRLVSCGCRPWASDLQRFSLSENEERLTTPDPFMLFFARSSARRTVRFLMTPQLQGFAQSESPFRRTRCYPTNAGRSSRGLDLSEVFTPLVSTPCFHEASSLGLSRPAVRQAAHRDVGSAEFQRTRGLACLFRELPTSMRFPSFTRLPKKSKCRTS
jgi:hypothetical protein